MNSLYSQPFAHYNTQPPLNLQAPQQQPQQGQSSQNQKIHFNGWERNLSVMGYSLCIQQLGLCYNVCPSISAALGCRGVCLFGGGGQFDHLHNLWVWLFWGLGIRWIGKMNGPFEKNTGSTSWAEKEKDNPYYLLEVLCFWEKVKLFLRESVTWHGLVERVWTLKKAWRSRAIYNIQGKPFIQKAVTTEIFVQPAAERQPA